MATPTRISLLHGCIAALNPTWIEIHRMQVPLSFSTAVDEDRVRRRLGLCDVSCLDRFGLKGPGAAEWLACQGVNPPAGINRWEPLNGGGVIARLGTNEFFIEDGIQGSFATTLGSALGRGTPAVYPVIRQDAAMAITGREAGSLLAQTCSFDFNGFDVNERLVVMTSMVGVSVLMIRSLRDEVPCYRIWCDGTYGPYLWRTLLEIAEELGGAAIGLGCLFPEVALRQT